MMLFFSDMPPVSTPHRSPRLVQSKYDIFVHQLEEWTGKILNTVEIIHNVDRSANLSKIIGLLMTIDNDEILYVPNKTIYWLRKGNKQPVLLKFIRIACSVFYACNSSSGTCLIWFFQYISGFVQTALHAVCFSYKESCTKFTEFRSELLKNMRTSNHHTLYCIL